MMCVWGASERKIFFLFYFISATSKIIFSHKISLAYRATLDAFLDSSNIRSSALIFSLTHSLTFFLILLLVCSSPIAKTKNKHIAQLARSTLFRRENSYHFKSLCVFLANDFISMKIALILDLNFKCCLVINIMIWCALKTWIPPTSQREKNEGENFMQLAIEYEDYYCCVWRCCVMLWSSEAVKKEIFNEIPLNIRENDNLQLLFKSKSLIP